MLNYIRIGKTKSENNIRSISCTRLKRIETFDQVIFKFYTNKLVKKNNLTLGSKTIEGI